MELLLLNNILSIFYNINYNQTLFRQKNQITFNLSKNKNIKIKKNMFYYYLIII